MGTITGISDLDPVRWKSSQWRNLQVKFIPHKEDFISDFVMWTFFKWVHLIIDRLAGMSQQPVSDEIEFLYGRLSLWLLHFSYAPLLSLAVSVLDQVICLKNEIPLIFFFLLVDLYDVSSSYDELISNKKLLYRRRVIGDGKSVEKSYALARWGNLH